MKRIYKYRLRPEAESMTITGLVQVLSLAVQHEEIVIYALIDLDSSTTTRVDYRVYGTGHDLEDTVVETYRFLGTANLNNGALMFHVYVKQE